LGWLDGFARWPGALQQAHDRNQHSGKEQRTGGGEDEHPARHIRAENDKAPKQDNSRPGHKSRQPLSQQGKHPCHYDQRGDDRRNGHRNRNL